MGNNIIVYFRQGELYAIAPQNGLSLYDDLNRAYMARYIVSDGIQYDLENSDSINSMHIPKFKPIEGLPKTSFDLSYHLKRKLIKEERPHIAVPLAYKTVNIMLATPIVWSKKDYYRVVIQLWSIGEIDNADYLLEKLKERLPTIAAEDEYKYGRTQSFKQNLQLAQELGEDYLVAEASAITCEKCAIYGNRIYNISGRDKRFPKFSDHIEDPAEFCCLSFCGTFIYPNQEMPVYVRIKSGEYIENNVDALKYSNRPFVDDRNIYQKEAYEELKKDIQKREKADKRYYNRSKWVEKYYCRKEYEEIVNKLGDMAPKSLDGYLRMKMGNTLGFQKLQKLAKQNNINIKEYME